MPGVHAHGLTKAHGIGTIGQVVHQKRRRVVASTMLILVVALALPVYFRIGWSRMESHCSGEPPGKAAFAAVEFSYTSRGFTCVYDDGARTEASYWFG
jgi:hypothetical protein